MYTCSCMHVVGFFPPVSVLPMLVMDLRWCGPAYAVGIKMGRKLLEWSFFFMCMLCDTAGNLHALQETM